MGTCLGLEEEEEVVIGLVDLICQSDQLTRVLIEWKRDQMATLRDRATNLQGLFFFVLF